MLANLSNSEIADRLGCAPATIKAHLRHINGKLGSVNKADAILIWLGIGEAA